MIEEKLAARVGLVSSAVYRRRRSLAPFRLHVGADALVGPDADDTGWPVLAPGSYWGNERQAFTLRTSFAVPDGWGSSTSVLLPLGVSKSLEALSFLYGPEGLVYIDGDALQGVDPNRQELLLPERYRGGDRHELAIDGWTGIKDERYEIGEPCLVEVDQPTRDFATAAQVTLQVARQLPPESPIRAKLLDALDAAVLTLDLREPATAAFYESVPAALGTLREGVSAAGPANDVIVTGVGHSHLDVAWLWPLSRTRKKAAQSFSNVLRLMEQFPEFRYTQSQPQLYQYVAEDHPQILEAVKARVAEGRWETIGGMWVEADCNITGGESLARQFLLGREYFLRTFGRRESPVLWLPDVFGYAWQLPQLIKRAGLEYFVTAKMSWNQFNRLPYDQFWWQGLDGTKILTNFITTSKPGWWGATYSADLTPEEIVTTWNEKQHKELHNEFLIPFGHGDGGGGPTRSMLAASREMREFAGLPKVQHGKVADYMASMERKSGSHLPTWNGELYFELHRGTYTSQARSKRANRKCEVRLHDAEFLAAWAALRGDRPYPHDPLRRAWELLCLNQFHDILPGASISQVYVDSMRDYTEIERICAEVRADSLEALDRSMPSQADIAVYNPTSFERAEVIELSTAVLDTASGVSTLDGVVLATQATDRGTLVAVPAVEPYGYLALQSRPTAGDAPPTAAVAVAVASSQDAHTLENSMLRVTFDKAGDIVGLYDKRIDRELLPAGQRANQWQAFEDRPLDWDAWDLDIFYDEKPWPVEPAASVTVIERGPLRAGLEIRRRVLNSEIVQQVSMYGDSARVDFATRVDWKERHVVLKVAFPVDVLSPKATFDIQWGNVERPTHRNTSWDWARFESCAHKWVDLSEGGFGSSLLNDCKYGHDIRDNVIRLTILRGATFPDPQADLGEHQFTYSLFPHQGDWRNGTVPAAYALNDPLIARRVQGERTDTAGAAAGSLISASAGNVVIETIKQAEDGDGLIVRLYENERTSGPVALRAGFPVAAAHECNILEEHEADLDVQDRHVSLAMAPYQIATIRLRQRERRPA